MRFLRTVGKVFANITPRGIILWIGVYLWQATPSLIVALGPAASWIASYWAVLFLGAAFLFLCITLAWLWMMLNDQHHLYETRKRFREESLRQQALQRQYVLVNMPACQVCPVCQACCLRNTQNNAN